MQAKSSQYVPTYLYPLAVDTPLQDPGFKVAADTLFAVRKIKAIIKTNLIGFICTLLNILDFVKLSEPNVHQITICA